MSESRRGLVLRGTGGVWHIESELGETLEVSLAGRLKREAGARLAVGDAVRIERDARDRAWAIVEILPRRSALIRRTPGGAYGERVVAANVDQVVVVFAAAEPEPHPRMLDRFLVIAAANDIPARVVVNKTDLADTEATRARFAAYEAAGYPVHYTSVVRGEGLSALREMLSQSVSTFTGPSGVGKSSLLNAMYPGLGLRVGEISRSVLKGRHTTVGAAMYPLSDGAYAMDTPGLREVGMWGIAPGTLDRCFPEFRGYVEECRFADCRHRTEPGCAVRAAVERGDVSRERYDSYIMLLHELDRTERVW
ncbi:MAG TPA: ribosome small subunit-dependent GTPase A [Gemmatimonadaceae bacterium]|nr:ribosome small subunit-dependent GTPase A [Gemmatimonadaceae bacterium]